MDGSVEPPMPDTPFSNSTSKNTGQQPKKKKLGLIISLCVLAVLLVGGGVFACIYLSWRQSDSVVLMNTVTNTIKASKIAVTGTVELNFSEASQDENGIKSMRINIDSAANNANSRGEGTLAIVPAEGDEVTIGIGGAFMSDGTVYLKIDGVAGALDNLRPELPEETATIIGYLEEFLTDLDGQWYKIDVADLDLDEDTTALYTCMVDAIKFSSTSDTRNELAKLYQEHPFLTATRQKSPDADGNAIFNVQWNAHDLANFSNDIKDAEVFRKYTSCGNESTEETYSITASYVTMPEDFPNINFHIDSWSHQLKGITANYEKDGDTLNANLKFHYDGIEIIAPEDAKSISNIVTSLEDALKKAVRSMLKEQITATCAQYPSDMRATCISAYNEQIEEYLKNVRFTELLIAAGIGLGSSM